MNKVPLIILGILTASLTSKSQVGGLAILQQDSSQYRKGYCGNLIIDYVKVWEASTYLPATYLDSIDDIANYTKVDKHLYRDNSGKPFLLNTQNRPDFAAPGILRFGLNT